MRAAFVLLALLVSAAPSAGAGMWDELAKALQDGRRLQALCERDPARVECKDYDAATVLTWCESPLENAYNRGRCEGALTAYAERARRTVPQWACVPAAVRANIDQMRRLFVREGRRLPEVLHLPAPNLLYYAVIRSFPCTPIR